MRKVKDDEVEDREYNLFNSSYSTYSGGCSVYIVYR